MQTRLTTFVARIFSLLLALVSGWAWSDNAALGESASSPHVETTPHRARRDWPPNPRVFILRVDQQIDHPQLFLLRRGVKRAIAERANALILVMDTPGGRVDLMREMVSLIIDLDIPTYTLVESDAFSAGAIIALATDHVFMQPRTVIGDAMPILAGPQGLQTLGDAEREKIESAMDAIVRSIAQHKGRDEMLIRAMVRKDLEYVLEDGTVISPKGQILTLTNVEAARILPNGKPLLSEGTVENLDEMLRIIGLENATRIEETRTWADQIALLITRIAPLLLTLALALFYLEINSPGIGWMGATALVLFLVVMFGHHVAGLAGMEDMLLIAVGLLLILIEVIFLPGFGFVGLLGTGLTLWGLIQAMIIRYPGNPGQLPGLNAFGNVGPAITTLGVALIGSAGLLALFLKNLGEHQLLGKKLVLDTAIPAPPSAALRSLVGHQGRCLRDLAPTGTITLDGKEYEAISDGDVITAGTAVEVIGVRYGQLLVSKAF